MDSLLTLSRLLYLVPSRCSSGFDRYRQEWLAYGCAQEVSLASSLLSSRLVRWDAARGLYPIVLLLVACGSLTLRLIPDMFSVLL